MRLESLLPANLASSMKVHKDIVGLSEDSRLVGEGYLFAALSGTQLEGANFIDDAIIQGARVILTSESSLNVADDVTVLYDKNPRKVLSHIASRFFARQPSHIAAVTGTNGKSSVVEFCRQIWSLSGYHSASLGTLGVQSDSFNMSLNHTTPSSIYLYEILRDLYQIGVTHLAMEASSHGLAQHRMDDVKVRVAGFTNFTRDHLDYHKTEALYLASKSRLFLDVLDEDGVAVLNSFGHGFEEILSVIEKRRHCFVIGSEDGCDLQIRDVTPCANGLKFQLIFEGYAAPVFCPVFCLFQAENIALAVGISLNLGVSFESILHSLPKLHAPKGRMEKVVSYQGGVAYVDYAHTPDALKTVLMNLALHCEGRLICVFGCGGERDTGKRSQMGAIASEYADQVIITDDNPRHEDSGMIRKEILGSCPQAIEIGNREEAIACGLEQLSEGDILLIAGKGHETGQIIGDDILQFSDQETLKKIVKTIKKGSCDA